MKTSNTLYINHLQAKAVIHLNNENLMSIAIKDHWGFVGGVILSYEEVTNLKKLCEKLLKKVEEGEQEQL